MRHYEVIYNDVTYDRFYIKDYDGMRKFYDIVISEPIKNELEGIGVKNVEYIPVKAVNHTRGQTLTGLYKLKTKNIVFFYFKFDPSKIPDDFDISCDSETPCRLFISERVKEIFMRNGLTQYKYIPV